MRHRRLLELLAKLLGYLHWWPKARDDDGPDDPDDEPPPQPLPPEILDIFKPKEPAE